MASVTAVVCGVAAGGFAAPVVPRAEAASTAVAVAVGARPGATRVPFTMSDELQASVDVGSGNLMVSTVDRAAPGINGMVNFGLAYQSLALGSGSQVTTGAAASWFVIDGLNYLLYGQDPFDVGP